MPPILDRPDDDGSTGPDGRRLRHPRNPPLRRRAKSKLKVRTDAEVLGLAGPIRKCDHTTVRFDHTIRAKLLYLASRVYGGTSNSTVLRLLIEAAYQKAVGRNDPGGKVASKAQRYPAPEPGELDLELNGTAAISPKDLKRLLTLKTAIDAETLVPMAMIVAWEPFDHRPWTPGLLRIWAWVQAREERLKAAFARARSSSSRHKQRTDEADAGTVTP